MRTSFRGYIYPFWGVFGGVGDFFQKVPNKKRPFFASLRQSRLVRKEGGGEVALARVGEQGNDGHARVLRTACDHGGRVERGA